MSDPFDRAALAWIIGASLAIQLAILLLLIFGR